MSVPLDDDWVARMAQQISAVTEASGVCVIDGSPVDDGGMCCLSHQPVDRGDWIAAGNPVYGEDGD